MEIDGEHDTGARRISVTGMNSAKWLCGLSRAAAISNTKQQSPAVWVHLRVTGRQVVESVSVRNSPATHFKIVFAGRVTCNVVKASILQGGYYLQAGTTPVMYWQRPSGNWWLTVWIGSDWPTHGVTAGETAPFRMRPEQKIPLSGATG